MATIERVIEAEKAHEMIEMIAKMLQEGGRPEQNRPMQLGYIALPYMHIHIHYRSITSVIHPYQ